MQIHITKNGQQLGPFDEEQLTELLESRQISYDDLAWVDGMTDWQPLRQLVVNPTGVPPPSPVSPLPSNDPVLSLWNPNWAVNWCVLLNFIPLGPYLHFLNAKALGRENEAKANRKWACVFLGIYILMLVLGTLVSRFSPDDIAFLGTGAVIGICCIISLGLVITWYFSTARKQINYVKEVLGKTYTRQSWLKPMVAGLALGFIVPQISSNLLAGDTDVNKGSAEVNGAKTEQAQERPSGGESSATNSDGQTRTVQSSPSSGTKKEEGADKEPFNFSFGHIPFGSNENEVVQAFESIPEFKNYKAMCGGSPGIGDFSENVNGISKAFNDGLFVGKALQGEAEIRCYHPVLVKTVQYTGDVNHLSHGTIISNLTHADLCFVQMLFYRPKNAKNFRLFAVKACYVQAQEKSSNSVSNFAKMRDSLTQALKCNPETVCSDSENDDKLRGSCWSLPQYKVGLITGTKRTEGLIIDTSEIICINRSAFEGYLSSLNSTNPPTQNDLDEECIKLIIAATGKDANEVQKLVHQARGDYSARNNVLPPLQVDGKKADSPQQNLGNSTSQRDHEYMIQQGKVIQVIKEGLLIVDPYGPIDLSTGPQGIPHKTIILLTGYPDAVVDEDSISWPCIMKSTGTFQYTTTDGATKTVRKFAFVRKGN